MIARALLIPVAAVSLAGAMTLGLAGWIVSDVSCALLWLPDQVWPLERRRT